MGIFDGCLLACDIDGTLVENGFINPRNLQKIEYFFKEGGKFSLSTGRSVGAISDVLKSLKKISPSIVANGCMIYDYENEKSLYEAYISSEDYSITKQIVENKMNIGVEIHSGDNVFAVRCTNESDDHQSYEKIIAQKVSFDYACNFKWNKAIFMFDSFDDRELFKKSVSIESENSDFIDTCATFGGRTRYYYEQLPKGVSKAETLLKLKNILSIKDGGLFAIGDYYNDLGMIKCADIGAATLDAPDDIKMFAEFVTGSCKDGAVADFIEYLTGKFSAK
ncbi:MAG: HAD-IIB family hydrolase [Clostridia bacterium]|nr:HAD-IIB family hydrolase [Clostridia bacterium]